MSARSLSSLSRGIMHFKSRVILSPRHPSSSSFHYLLHIHLDHVGR